MPLPRLRLPARTPRASRAAALGLAAALLAGGCTTTRAGATAPQPEPAEPVPAASMPAASPTPEPFPADARVGVTATGVPVEVVARSSAGLTVTTPCGGTTVLGALTALGEVQVVLDPGHGGPVDTGALGPNGLTEAALNLRVAEAVRSQLEQRGLSAMLTRTGDYALPLSVRASLADAAGAAVFVSLHHNAPRSAPSPVPGTEVFVQSTSTESSRLGTLLYDHVTAALSQFDVAWTRRHDAGVLRVTLPDGSDAYGVVRRPATTTALVELGYLANPSEAQLFATDTYVEAAGAAVAAAIADFVAGEASSPAPTGQRTMTPGRAQGGHDCVDPPLG